MFSWIYDISSKGIKKTAVGIDTIPSEIDIEIGQRLNKIIIVSLIIVVILLLYNQFSNQSLIPSENSLVHNGLTGTVAVLPFINNKPNPESDYFGFAIANQIIGDLNYLQNISVRSASRIRKYDKQVIDLNKIKEDLNVEYVLIGNYLSEDNRIRLNMPDYLPAKHHRFNLNFGRLLFRNNLKVPCGNILGILLLQKKK